MRDSCLSTKNESYVNQCNLMYVAKAFAGIFIGHIDLLQSGRKERGNNGGARYDSKRSKKNS